MDRLTVAYQAQLRQTRDAVSAAVGGAWTRLGSYNQADIPRFLGTVEPVVRAGQLRAASLAAAYSARRIGHPMVGIDTARAQGAAVRNGTPPAEVYRRPFVSVWTALKNGDNYDDAVTVGFDLATSSAQMDVGLSSMAAYVLFAEALNGALRATGDTAGEIVAWRRVAEGGCCDFCQEIDGAYTGPDQPQPLHNRCGCSAEPILRKSHQPTADLRYLNPGTDHGITAIELHGELGPVITQAGDHFTNQAEALAGR